MAKQFSYRGKSIDELKKLENAEFINLLPSRQRRKLARGFTAEQKKLLKRIELVLNGKSKKQIKTHCRDMIILPKMIGNYLGEYSLTRSKVAHSAPGVGATRSSAAASVK